MFRRLFDLLGCSWFGVDFPPLKNPHKRKTVVAIWLQLIDYLDLPYINSDPQLFGGDVYVDPFDAWEYGTRIVRAANENAKATSPTHADTGEPPPAYGASQTFEDLVELVSAWEENSRHGH